jgi:hypothetical protein
MPAMLARAYVRPKCAMRLLADLLRVNTSRAAYAAATAEVPPIPAVITRGSQLTLRAICGHMASPHRR